METTRAARVVEQSVGAPAPLGMGLLSSLDAGSFDELPPAGVLDAVRGWERLAGTVAVEQARAVRALAARISAERDPARGLVLLDEEVTEELALALRVSTAAAQGMRDFADGLALLGATADALARGALGSGHARVLVDVLTGGDPLLADTVRTRLEHQLLAYAAAQPVTPAQLRRRAHRLILTADPDGAAQRRRRARRGRYVSCRPDAHGMAWLTAYLPAADAQACYATLDTHARRRVETDPDDDRGLGARRADALLDRLLTGHLDGPPHTESDRSGDTDGDRGGGDSAGPVVVTRQVCVDVTVSLTTLLGLSNTPGELGGHGPIDADLARELAHSPDATWRRLLTDPTTGTVLDVGTTRYRPPAPLDRFIRRRDYTCRWPGCTTPATHCDLDHTQPYPDGPTSRDNLITLCRRHHRLKTLTDFATEQQPDGHLHVTTPTGRVLTTGPPAADPAAEDQSPEDEPPEDQSIADEPPEGR